MSTTRRFGLLLVASLLAGAAGACEPGGIGEARSSSTQAFDTTVTTGSSLTLRVDMFNGPIEVRAGKPGTIHAEVTTTGAGGSKAEAEADRQRIQVTLDLNPDGTALLRAVYQPNPRSPGARSASAVVEVPAATALDLRTSNAAVDSTGVTGSVSVSSSNGAVTVAGPAAGATIRTTNGAVEIDGAGMLDVQTTNAAVSISGTGATLLVRTSNGAVSFEGTFSASAQAVSTTNAAITLRLPAGTGFVIDARTTNEKVTVEGFTVSSTGSLGGVALQGVVGGGGPYVTLRASNAPIQVKAT